MPPRLDRRLVFALALLLVWSLAWVTLGTVIAWQGWSSEQQALARELLLPKLGLWVVVLGAAIVPAGWLAQRFIEKYARSPARLAAQTRALVDTVGAVELPPQGTRELRAVADAIAALAESREALRQDMSTQVRQAAERIDLERARLAGLMSELGHAIVVCNLDGRVMLYNNRARLQFRALSRMPGLAAGAELIGLGRSIHAAIDPRVISHALGNIRQRLDRGAMHPVAQFMTPTQGGQLLRVQMTGVRDPAHGGQAPLSGYVLVLDNVTREFEQADALDRRLHSLSENSLAQVAGLQLTLRQLPAAVSALPEAAAPLSRLKDGLQQLDSRIRRFGEEASQGARTRWPLEPMLGAEFIAAAQRRIEAHTDLKCNAGDVDDQPWLRLDSYSLMQALLYLAQRIEEEFEVATVQLRLRSEGFEALLDIGWVGPAASTETLVAWEIDPMRIGGETLPITVRDVAERHSGRFQFERERVRHLSFFRFRLPLMTEHETDTAAPAPPADDSRPEYYDFDLFAQPASDGGDWRDRPLAGLIYTVFDTETTGLNPSAGDEIIQIGAARIVNGRLLRHECFEQLVNPQRSLPPAGIAIHGIEPEMLVGQPTITEVLPAFHDFAHDTVLVAHNAAFDMRFLQLKEAVTGLRFDQPVLDTLLLSALLQPEHGSHRLDAIATRFGIEVLGRHTALGDALTTAEVFLRLLQLLKGRGIETLGQALDAARDTWYARLKY